MDLLEQIYEAHPENTFINLDGFNGAILGLEESSLRLIYSISKILRKLMEDMSYEQAVEYFDFNIQGAYMGEQTPIYCYDYDIYLPDEDINYSYEMDNEILTKDNLDEK